MTENYPVNPQKTQDELIAQVSRIANGLVARAFRLPEDVLDLSSNPEQVDELKIWKANPLMYELGELSYYDSNHKDTGDGITYRRGLRLHQSRENDQFADLQHVYDDGKTVQINNSTTIWKMKSLIRGYSSKHILSHQHRLNNREIVGETARMLAKLRGEVAKREVIAKLHQEEAASIPQTDVIE